MAGRFILMPDPGIEPPWHALLNPASRKTCYWNSISNVITHARPSCHENAPSPALEQLDAELGTSIDKAFMRRPRRAFYCWHEMRCLFNEVCQYNKLQEALAQPETIHDMEDDLEYSTWLLDMRERLDRTYLWHYALRGVHSLGLWNCSNLLSQCTCPLPVSMCNSYSTTGGPWVLDAEGVFRSSLVISSPEPGQALSCKGSSTEGTPEHPLGQVPGAAASTAGERLDCGVKLTGNQQREQEQETEQQELEVDVRSSVSPSTPALLGSGRSGAWDEQRLEACTAAVRQRKGLALSA